MSSHTFEDLTSCILDFQANMVRVMYRKKHTIVEPDSQSGHAASLNYIWACSRVREDPDPDGGTIKWRRLGFDSEDMSQEFREVGVLGLDCMVSSPRGDMRWEQRPLMMKSAPRTILSHKTRTSSQRCGSRLHRLVFN